MNIAYFILLSLIFLIKIAFNVSAQPHPYFKFEGDTSLVKNKDCSCFDNFKYLMRDVEVDKKGGKEYIDFFQEINLSRFNNHPVQDLIDSINTIYPIIEYEVNYSKYKKPVKNSKHNKLEVFFEIGGVNCKFYYTDSIYLSLTICLRDNDSYCLSKSDFVEEKQIQEILRKTTYCAYLMIINIQNELNNLKIFEKETGNAMFKMTIDKRNKLQERMKEYSKQIKRK